ncbi:MAG: hypothetical protein JRG96_12155 [Deltaproteobacteria bacterium]|nr:hypothetical protein [Deltaproteobacteria bacterium]MBW2417722.1 hypothetical protein [Deltaproteobacteria bacterium]
MGNPKPSKKVRLVLSPEAQKYVGENATVATRRMAAGGALPLEPIELATVLYALLHDPDAEVKERAHQSLAGLPEAVLDIVLTGPSHPVLLAFMAHIHREDGSICERIALNQATSDETIAFLATLPQRRLVDIISNNQSRLMRNEAIVEALGENPLTGRAVIERILTFLGVSPEIGDEDSDDELGREDALSEEDAEAAIMALLGDDTGHLAKHLAAEGAEKIEDEELMGSLFNAVQKMGVMQKIKLARNGGKEARSLLIRDRNKVVSTSVIQSPKITESEVIAIAQNRSVTDDVLRIVSNNREWTRNYKIKLALTTNPKSPQPTAIKFLNYLQDRDLKNIMKSRDVPSVISSHARRLLQKKGKI